MKLITLFVIIIIGLSFCVMVLYVAFGQITVRKLRKNPETKDVLGIEFASGWDIINVAGALSRPKWLSNMFNRSKLSFLAANSETIYRHTNSFDRLLAKLFWWMYIFSGTFMIIILILNFIGVFEV